MSPAQRNLPVEHFDPDSYAVVWFAPRHDDFRAAVSLLDESFGAFPTRTLGNYTLHAGVMSDHRIVIATLPTNRGDMDSSVMELAAQVKMILPNLWFGRLVAVATGLPDMSQNPSPRDIRLGDVLVALPTNGSAGVVAYEHFEETNGRFRLSRGRFSLPVTATVVCSAIGSISLELSNDMFMQHYEKIQPRFPDPGQRLDTLLIDHDGSDYVLERIPRPDCTRTRVWYGVMASGATPADSDLRKTSKNK
ncbi:hypothetical protein NQ176_g7126 [Zarea fungicola]|uniref:Uncharacterized protein n=1 Tax=Zarea fungicola TaxID=93591 RepID=A0ACC1MZR4_9HYPO|nr:hypothetical protein NQ176_g7126 [Lecanicillium fungicola]